MSIVSHPSPQHREATSKYRAIRGRFAVGVDDTTDRLSYAREWEASESDPERALLIRLQLRMAEIGRDHPEWFRLRTQTEEILLDEMQSMVPGWFTELGIRNPVFHRGFIEGCVVPMRTLLNPNDRRQLFDFAPIRHLTVTGIEPRERLNLLFGAPEFRQIISLAIDRQGLTDESLRTFATYKPQNLQWLSIRNNHLTADSLDWLTDLPNLRYVDFSGHGPESEEDVDDDQGVILSRTPPPLAQRFPFLRGPMPDRYSLWRLEPVSTYTGQVA